MTHFMCKTCGTQFPDSDAPPQSCPICDDERQYIGWDGQQWTTLDELRKTQQIITKEEEPNLIGVGMKPGYGINQRAQLIKTPGGNILWECVAMLDDACIEAVKSHGGISAIAISHPHYYSTMIEWSRTFNNAPIYLHKADKNFVMRPDPVIQFWDGDSKPLHDGITLVHCGGHFAGSNVLIWPAGAEGRGVMLAGDTIYVVQDRRWVSFMWSYPNHIPLNPTAVTKVVASVEPYAFDRIYSAWFDRTLDGDAKARVKLSAERYIKAMQD